MWEMPREMNDMLTRSTCDFEHEPFRRKHSAKHLQNGIAIAGCGRRVQAMICHQGLFAANGLKHKPSPARLWPGAFVLPQPLRRLKGDAFEGISRLLLHERNPVPESFHSYEPRQGHRLPHDPFNMIVGPRPIGWISTRSASGALNLAPYSFFNGFNYIPPIVGFSSVGSKDTVRNVEETGEFAWNLVTRELAEAMNQTSAPLPPEVSEFTFSGLTPTDSKLISPPRVSESPVSFECRCTGIVQLQSASGEKLTTWLVLGEVVMVHIAQRLLNGGIYDTAAAGHVLRGGGPADYFTIGPEQLFRMWRPK
jgi:flavin reductase (DIM6/NTAB) family NADH-FMN oxidoreductase RutF